MAGILENEDVFSILLNIRYLQLDRSYNHNVRLIAWRVMKSLMTWEDLYYRNFIYIVASSRIKETM